MSAEPRPPARLRLEALEAGYGLFLVLRGIDLEALPGVTVILGPNGAGKTTLLKAIAGLVPRTGRVLLDGVELAAGTPTSALLRRGIALVAEGRQLFPQMTVAENLELGGWLASASERAPVLDACCGSSAWVRLFQVNEGAMASTRLSRPATSSETEPPYEAPAKPMTGSSPLRRTRMADVGWTMCPSGQVRKAR